MDLKFRVPVLAVTLFAACMWMPNSHSASIQEAVKKENCPESGAVDAAQVVDSLLEQSLHGWVLSARQIERIEIRAGNLIVAQGNLEIERPEVQANFPGCKHRQLPGFDIAVQLARIPAATQSMTLTALTVGGQEIELGSVPVNLEKPLGFIETSGPLSWQGVMNVSGWALSQQGDVNISIFANGELIVTGKTDRHREDVNALYDSWKNSDKSGFDIPIPFHLLPKGQYVLRVRLEDTRGNNRTLAGPEVVNNRSFAFISAEQKIFLDGENVIRGWAISATGKSEVRVSALGEPVARIEASKSRDDVANVFKNWPNARHSGFDKLISLRNLPRGRYRLTIEFADESGVYQTSPGPLVLNDFPIGRVFAEDWSMLNPDEINLKAWVADEDGIESVDLVNESGRLLGSFAATSELTSYPPLAYQTVKDFGEASPVVRLGRIYNLDFNGSELAQEVSRLNVRARDNTGTESILPGPLVVRRTTGLKQDCKGEVFRLFMPGETFFLRRGFKELKDIRALVESDCVQVGLRGRVEYLRTTRGKTLDYTFDPDFPDELRVQEKGTITSTSLAELLHYKNAWNLPLMITLDAGPWADAKFSVPSIDIVDVLEESEINVQWNQYGRAEEDDALTKLPGSYGSPELARMMSLNIYNNRFRFYKRRNLQAAVQAILKSETTGSSGSRSADYIAVSLDPDQYINPWFYMTQWYDYNPNTLRQFREWMTHTGAYTEGGYLQGHGLKPALDIKSINRIADRQWKKLEAVEPPREELDYTSNWHQIWTQFKRHLVARHYDDLALWVNEAGLDTSKIFTSQTFIQTNVSVTGSDQASGWTDEAGVSISGAKPSRGHLGAILYGPASRNEGSVRSGKSLFQNIRDIDSRWGVVELHPATIEFPERSPDHTASYTTISNLLNYGAHFVSPMWGSHVADRFVYPDRFRSYDAFVGSEFEYQLVWMLLHRQSLPAGSLSYPFGNRLVISDDGWTADSNTELEKKPGFVRLNSSQNHVVFSSPEFGSMSRHVPMKLVLKGNWGADINPMVHIKSNGKIMAGLNLIKKGSHSEVILPSEISLGMDALAIEWSSLSNKNRRQEPIGEIIIQDISLY